MPSALNIPRIQQSLNAWKAAADNDCALFIGPDVIRLLLDYVAHLESLLGEE